MYTRGGKCLEHMEACTFFVLGCCYHCCFQSCQRLRGVFFFVLMTGADRAQVCSGQHSEDWCPRGACVCSSQNSVFAADEEEEERDMGGDEDEENQRLLSGDRNVCGIRKVTEKMCGRKRKRRKVVSSEARLTAAKITVIGSQHNTSQRCFSWGTFT